MYSVNFFQVPVLSGVFVEFVALTIFPPELPAVSGVAFEIRLNYSRNSFPKGPPAKWSGCGSGSAAYTRFRGRAGRFLAFHQASTPGRT